MAPVDTFTCIIIKWKEYVIKVMKYWLALYKKLAQQLTLADLQLALAEA